MKIFRIIKVILRHPIRSLIYLVLATGVVIIIALSIPQSEAPLYTIPGLDSAKLRLYAEQQKTETSAERKQEIEQELKRIKQEREMKSSQERKRSIPVAVAGLILLSLIIIMIGKKLKRKKITPEGPKLPTGLEVDK